MIKNLVFKGGGVLGISYAGALEILEQNNILQNIERVAGTSAGAITACLVSLNYTAEEITKIVNETDFKSFEDNFNPLRIETKYGLYSGNTFLEWIKDKISKKGISENSTFSDFKNNKCKDLHIFATDLNEKGLKKFSFEDTPNVIVAEAIRASMSIPLFFESWQFTNNIPDNHIYVDGGAIYNYPITCFDKDGNVNNETLGFFLSDLNNSKQQDDLKHNELIHYVKNLFNIVLNSQVIDFKNNPEEQLRTVVIDNLGISATDFKITDNNKKLLYESGKKYTTEYLNKLK